MRLPPLALLPLVLVLAACKGPSGTGTIARQPIGQPDYSDSFLDAAKSDTFCRGRICGYTQWIYRFKGIATPVPGGSCNTAIDYIGDYPSNNMNPEQIFAVSHIANFCIGRYPFAYPMYKTRNEETFRKIQAVLSSDYGSIDQISRLPPFVTTEVGIQNLNAEILSLEQRYNDTQVQTAREKNYLDQLIRQRAELTTSDRQEQSVIRLE